MGAQATEFSLGGVDGQRGAGVWRVVRQQVACVHSCTTTLALLPTEPACCTAEYCWWHTDLVEGIGVVEAVSRTDRVEGIGVVKAVSRLRLTFVGIDPVEGLV